MDRWHKSRSTPQGKYLPLPTSQSSSHHPAIQLSAMDGDGKADSEPQAYQHVEEEATIIPSGTIDPVYEAKARVLNAAIQEIGMGWYQWQLFIVVGFGWANDNLWPIVTSLICELIINILRPILIIRSHVDCQ